MQIYPHLLIILSIFIFLDFAISIISLYNDLGSDFNTGTYTFTAPVTGKYLLEAHLDRAGLDVTTHTTIEMELRTSNRVYWYFIYDVSGVPTTNAPAIISVIADMDASDTAYVYLYVTATNKTVDIIGGANPSRSHFSGSLIN